MQKEPRIERVALRAPELAEALGVSERHFTAKLRDMFPSVDLMGVRVYPVREVVETLSKLARLTGENVQAVVESVLDSVCGEQDCMHY